MNCCRKSQRKDRELIVSVHKLLENSSTAARPCLRQSSPLFNGGPVRRHRTDAPDDNESQKPLRSPSPKTRHKGEMFNLTALGLNTSGDLCTCMRSMMTVRFLSWTGPSTFRTRFINVMLLHSTKSSSSPWPRRTSSSFSNSATCWSQFYNNKLAQ